MIYSTFNLICYLKVNQTSIVDRPVIYFQRLSCPDLQEQVQKLTDRKPCQRNICGHVWTSHTLETCVLTAILQKKRIHEDERLPLRGHPSTPFNTCLCTFSPETQGGVWFKSFFIYTGLYFNAFFLLCLFIHSSIESASCCSWASSTQIRCQQLYHFLYGPGCWLFPIQLLITVRQLYLGRL